MRSSRVDLSAALEQRVVDGSDRTDCPSTSSSSSQTRLAESIRIAISSPDPAAPTDLDSGPPCAAAADNLEH